MMTLDELGRKLDNMGWTLHYAQDLVDGSRIVVLDWTEVAGLVADYEASLSFAWGRGYGSGKRDAATGETRANPYGEDK